MTRAPLRGLVGIIGLLLTPLVAWAASFFGGWLAALLGSFIESDRVALWTLVGGSVLGAVLGTVVWVGWLVRYRKNHAVPKTTRATQPGDGGSKVS